MALMLSSEQQSGAESGAESMEDHILRILYDKPISKSAISKRLGQKTVTGRLNRIIRQLLADEYIEYTVPEKPKSRIQQYRLTKKGKERLGRDTRNRSQTE